MLVLQVYGANIFLGLLYLVCNAATGGSSTFVSHSQPWLAPCGQEVDLSVTCRLNTTTLDHYSVNTRDVKTLKHLIRSARWIEKSATALRNTLLHEILTDKAWKPQRYQHCTTPLLDNKSKALVLTRSFTCLMEQSVRMQALKIALSEMSVEEGLELDGNYVNRLTSLLHDNKFGLVTTLCIVENHLSGVMVCLPPPHRRYISGLSGDDEADDNSRKGGKVQCKRFSVIKRAVGDLDKMRSVAKDVRKSVKVLLKYYMPS